MKNLLYIVFFILFISCTDKSTNKLTSYDLEQDTLIRIQNWSLLGPFHIDTMYQILDFNKLDLLVKYGESEGDIDSMPAFQEISRRLQKKDTSMVFREISIPKHILKFREYIKVKPPTACYLASVIECEDSCTVALLMSAYKSCKLWINKELIYEVDWKRGRSKYREEFIPVRLKKGNNFLLAKISTNNLPEPSIQWKFELDISNLPYSKNIFDKSYFRHFIRRSLLKKGDILKIYVGPYSMDTIKVRIENKNTNSIYNYDVKANTINGLACISLPNNAIAGLYTCSLQTKNNILNQDFFYGDVDEFYSNLICEYNRIKGIDSIQNINIEGIIQRCYIDKRREDSDFDDQAEYWNRIRIPSLNNLYYTVQDIKQKNKLRERFFFRGYKSNYLNSIYYYSAYVPLTIDSAKNIPLFFILETNEEPIDNWRDHWRNYTSNGLDEIIDIADKFGIIVVWTNCGGGDKDRVNTIFSEIIENVNRTLPVNDKNTYLISNCGSTQLALELLFAFPKKIKGVGFVNPMCENVPKPNINMTFDQDFVMLYAYYDERIKSRNSIAFYNSLLKINPNIKLITSYNATHYCNPSDYIEPVFKYLISLESFRTNKE